MHYWILARAVAAGVAFGGVVAFAYWWFRRGRPETVAHTWKIFLVLAVLIAIRLYFLNAP